MESLTLLPTVWYSNGFYGALNNPKTFTISRVSQIIFSASEIDFKKCTIVEEILKKRSTKSYSFVLTDSGIDIESNIFL